MVYVAPVAAADSVTATGSPVHGQSRVDASVTNTNEYKPGAATNDVDTSTLATSAADASRSVLLVALLDVNRSGTGSPTDGGLPSDADDAHTGNGETDTHSDAPEVQGTPACNP